MIVYTVTTVPDIKDKSRWREIRCIGLYQKFKDANRAVVNNYGDMYEYMYTYAVIEPTLVDCIYGYVRSEDDIGQQFHPTQWYKWNKKEKRYKPIKTPKIVSRIVGWGVG